MLINLSNHPFATWSTNQVKEAQVFGEIIDIPFPNLDPFADANAVEIIAREYYQKIVIAKIENKEKAIIHLTGEPTFCFLLAQLLLKGGYVCLSSTSERIVKTEKEGKKISVYNFCGFREYKLVEI